MKQVGTNTYNLRIFSCLYFCSVLGRRTSLLVQKQLFRVMFGTSAFPFTVIRLVTDSLQRSPHDFKLLTCMQRTFLSSFLMTYMNVVVTSEIRKSLRYLKNRFLKIFGQISKSFSESLIRAATKQ